MLIPVACETYLSDPDFILTPFTDTSHTVPPPHCLKCKSSSIRSSTLSSIKLEETLYLEMYENRYKRLKIENSQHRLTLQLKKAEPTNLIGILCMHTTTKAKPQAYNYTSNYNCTIIEYALTTKKIPVRYKFAHYDEFVYVHVVCTDCQASRGLPKQSLVHMICSVQIHVMHLLLKASIIIYHYSRDYKIYSKNNKHASVSCTV